MRKERGKREEYCKSRLVLGLSHNPRSSPPPAEGVYSALEEVQLGPEVMEEIDDEDILRLADY